jgi:hypothetical protein
VEGQIKFIFKTSKMFFFFQRIFICRFKNVKQKYQFADNNVDKFECKSLEAIQKREEKISR